MRPIYLINVLLLLTAIALTILWATSKPSAMENPPPIKSYGNIIRAEKTTDVKPLEFYKEVVMKRNIFAKVTPKLTVNVISPQTRFKLTGIAFDPKRFSAAFIYDSVKKIDAAYYEGDPLDEWTIKKIERQRVILINANKDEAVLTQIPDTVSASNQISLPKGNRGDEFTSHKPETERITPERVNEITKGIKEILKNTSPEFIYDKIEEYVDISRTDISPNVKLDDYATRLLLLNEGADISGQGEGMTFGTTVKQDNAPINPTTTFNATRDKRIYASFPNAGLLQGLSKVSTRWMNATNGEIAYLGTQPINAAAPNNYIYVEKAKGWSKGIYQVELYRVDTMDKVAQGRFEIKE